MQLLQVLLAVAAASNVIAIPRVGAPNTAENTLECTYLVRFPDSVQDPEAAVHQHMKQFPSLNYQIRTSLKNEFATLASFQIESVCDEDNHVASIAGASYYQSVREINPPAPFVSSDISNAATAFKHTTDSIHKMTGVDRARSELGLTGKGIKVGVIDSGVFYKHPALGGCFGPGCRVVTGDLYGSNKTAPILPDNDPIDTCSSASHGTHVAGIIGANALNIVEKGFVPTIPFTGVAPEVTLGAYRVFGCSGKTGNDIITAAIYRAAGDGMDIINMSLGGGPSFNDEPDDIAIHEVSKKGFIVHVSSGNDGDAGPMSTSSPGVSRGAISIASFDNGELYAPVALTIGGIDYPATNSVAETTHFGPGTILTDIVVNNADADSLDVQSDGCTLASMNPAVKGKHALIRWGSTAAGVGCGSVARCGNAYKAGAISCLIYFNLDGVVNTKITGVAQIPGIIMPRQAGLAILADIVAKKTPSVALSFNKPFELGTGGTLSEFSAPGLDPELNFKPELAGIGGHVLSTISTYSQQVNGYAGPYADMSGTSMSSPYTAGVSALLLQKRGKMSLENVKGYLLNNAVPAPIYNTSLTNSPAYQGAGLVNAYYSVIANTLVLPASIALNDTLNIKDEYKITIQNNYASDITYKIMHKTAATFSNYIAGDDYNQDLFTTIVTDDQHATVTFLSDKCNEEDTQGVKTVFVPAGKSVDVGIHFAPAKSTGGANPIYGGYITITNNVDEVVSTVPYVGMINSWKAKGFWSRNSPSLLQNWLQPITKGAAVSASTGLYADATFTPLKANDIINATNVVNILAIPTYTNRFASIQVFGTDDTLVKAGFSSNSALVDFAGLGGALWDTGMQRTNFATQQSVQANQVFPWAGNAWDMKSNATKSSRIPSGTYFLRFAGLRNFGDVNNNADFDVLDTPPFKLVF
ncbi:UNVERIFIED_CONTAM: hypothetical protein HDU68_000216 [Siphonaria sp. JEL0065]|nr:hypothetical protein HDU68_000216 [Siphonaria sp. JEL0065]